MVKKGSPYNRLLRPLGRVEVYSSTQFKTSALKMGWGVSTTPRQLYHRERPGTHCTGVWEGPRAGLDGCEKSRPPPIGIRSPDRRARSESLYRLSYPGHEIMMNKHIFLCRDSGLIPCHSLWDFWWSEWHWNRLFSVHCGFPSYIRLH